MLNLPVSTLLTGFLFCTSFYYPPVKTTFEIKNRGFNLHVQDNYAGYTALSINFKRKFVGLFIEQAKNKRAQDLYINFLSLSGMLTPYTGAAGHHLIDGMNVWLCKQYREKQTMGIIVADFVDIDEGDIIKTVVNSNDFV